MKFDLDTMYVMSKWSDNKLATKIAKMYHEADDKGDKLQIAHLSFVMTNVIDPAYLKTVGGSVTKWNDLAKTVDNTGGDIKKIKDYDKLIAAQESAYLICDATKSTKYMGQHQELYKTIIDNTSSFTKGYKKDSSITKLIYQSLVITWLEGLFVLTAASLAVQNVPNMTVDKYIEKTEGWKSLYDRANAVLTDKDFKKLITASSDTMLKAEAIDMYAEEIARHCTVYSEVSLQDVALLIKLGLAKTCYVLFGLLRFLIFSVLVSKYQIEDKIESIKEIMRFNNADLASRSTMEDKLYDKVVDIRVDDIKAMSKADKEADNVQVKETEENQFSL